MSLGHVISPGEIPPIAKRLDDSRNLKSPQSKPDAMKVLGCLRFYSCHIKKLHVDSQPFFDLIKVPTPFHWTEQDEKLFKSIKERIHKDTVLTVSPIDYPFHIHLDSSNVGTGCILIQQFSEGERFISFNSRVFDKAELHSPSRTMTNRVSSPDMRTLHHWFTISHLYLL